MNQHTPGPWYVPEITEHDVDVTIHALVPGTKNKKYVARVYGEGTLRQTNNSNRDANLYLIAAAPAMLAALERIVCIPAFNGELFEKDTESHRAWTQAREAIREARGED